MGLFFLRSIYNMHATVWLERARCKPLYENEILPLCSFRTCHTVLFWVSGHLCFGYLRVKTRRVSQRYFVLCYVFIFVNATSAQTAKLLQITVCDLPSHVEHVLQESSRLCNWLSLRCLVPWINHLPPVCWSTFGILVWNDSGYVNLTQWWYFFIIFEYILHISTPHIMIFCFPLPYFPLSTSALFFA